DVVRAAYHDALAGLDACLDAHEIAIADGDFHEPPREALAAGVDEDVRATRFHQYRLLGNGGEALTSAGVENGRAGLADEELSVGILHFHLHGQRLRSGVEHARIVHVME